MTLIKAIIINDDISTDQMLLCKMHVGSKMKFRKHAIINDDISTDQMLLCKMHVGSKMKFRKHAFVIEKYKKLVIK